MARLGRAYPATRVLSRGRVITFVSAVASTTTTVATAAHLPNDFLVIVGWRALTTLPGLGAGWTTPTGGTDVSTSIGTRIGYRVAVGTDSTSDPSGTWTGAAALCNSNFRGGSNTGALAFGTGTGTVITYPALTLQKPGKSWVVLAVRHAAATNIESAAITGFTNRSVSATGGTVFRAAQWDSNGLVTSHPAVTQTVNTTGAWQCWSIEIIV